MIVSLLLVAAGLVDTVTLALRHDVNFVSSKLLLFRDGRTVDSCGT
jgi:hypothetical protein